MKRLLPLLLLVTLASCCRVSGLPVRPEAGTDAIFPALFSFRLEHKGVPKFSGLLALENHDRGIWCVLLDATGIPLVKELVAEDGSLEITYRAGALKNNRLPDLLGKVVHSIYFTTGVTDCSWYMLSCICSDSPSPDRTVKWRKFGPVRLWEVNKKVTPAQTTELAVRFFPSLLVQLQRLE